MNQRMMARMKTVLLAGLITVLLGLAGCDLFGGGGSGGGGGGGAPAAPTGLTVGSPTPVSLAVSWSASSGATSYTLYKDTSSSGSFGSQIYSGANLGFVDIPLTPGGTSYYKVLASNSSGSSGLSSAASGQAVGKIEWAKGSDNTSWYMSNDNSTLNYNKLFTIDGSTLSLGGLLTTNVTKYTGWTSGDIGVLFFYVDANNMWKYVIFPAGGYGVFQKISGTWYTIKTYTASTYVLGLGQTNRLDISYYFSSPNYTLDFKINNNLQYSLHSTSPYPGAGGGTGFVAQIGAGTKENFPTVPVFDTYAQSSPISYTGSMAGAGPTGSLERAQMMGKSSVPLAGLYQPPG
jgi:hypothetical protein